MIEAMLDGHGRCRASRPPRPDGADGGFAGRVFFVSSALFWLCWLVDRRRALQLVSPLFLPSPWPCGTDSS